MASARSRCKEFVECLELCFNSNWIKQMGESRAPKFNMGSNELVQHRRPKKMKPLWIKQIRPRNVGNIPKETWLKTMATH